MSRHEGVSCDSCLKGNFRGKRYKCLICYDYDLCATCYEAGATTTRHTTDHPVQCILTRSDFDLYYGGEAISVDQPQSYTCPFCGKMGYTEASLQEHVTSEHSDTSFEVVCPVCASLPGGEPNHVTDDFAAHLTLEHRSPRDLDEPSGSRHIRRIPHPGRGMSSARARRTQMQFSSSSGLSSLSPGSRESMDPIAELLSQLSGVRRTTTLGGSTTSQLQQLQMQLQLERQQAQAARQQLERLPRRQAQASSGGATSSSGAATNSSANNSGAVQSQYTIVFEPSPSPSASSSSGSQFLLSRCTEPTLTEAELQTLEVEHADRSLFVQELLLTSLAEHLNIIEDLSNLTNNLGLSSENELSESSLQTVSKTESSNVVLNVMNNSTGHAIATNHQQWTSCSQAQQTGQPSQLTHNSQSARSSASRKSPSSSSSSARQIGRSRGGSSSSNHTQPPRDANSQQLSTTRSGATSFLQQVPAREGLSSSRQVNRATGREAGSSPSSARRKVLRQVDDRNKSSEPPPPH